jgi:hypothetical protein
MRGNTGAKMIIGAPGTYRLVALWKNKKQTTYPIHRLMALAFIDAKYIGKGLVCDHIDMDKSNNNIDNLRVVTKRENAHNTRTRTTPPGVSRAGKRWRARILINGVRKDLGSWCTPELAHRAYLSKCREL